eukprot:TRINITY_DN4385_c0_g1_i1.p1 TRINITY_DN4385_c0_g1~~TRINITY_DN4385_c0_g1_i1.p1  ORF type:complete len:208 (-),score=31.56 TRINITY_DN4385_c0_g1_i1:120-743(-)
MATHLTVCTDSLPEKAEYHLHSCTASTCALSRQVSSESGFGEAWDRVFHAMGHVSDRDSQEDFSRPPSPASQRVEAVQDESRLRVPFAQKLGESRMHKFGGVARPLSVPQAERKSTSPCKVDRVPFAQKRYIARLHDPMDEFEFVGSVASAADGESTGSSFAASPSAGAVIATPSSVQSSFGHLQYLARLHDMEGVDFAGLHPSCTV